MSENPSPEEIDHGLRTGYSFDPATPGLQKAARDLLCPIIERMDGQEIIYVCRVPRLVRVDYLEVNDDGFRAVATPIHELGSQIMTMENQVRDWKNKPLDATPLDFSALWVFLRMSGSAICMSMITDHFYTNPALVALVKAAAAKHARQADIRAILDRRDGDNV
jgi:hypothetical protein